MSETHIPFYLRHFDWHPGEFIQDEMDALGYSQKELAERLGLSPKVVCDLIKHKTRITPEYALLLSRVLDRSAEYWTTLEKNWSESQARKAENDELDVYRDWITKFQAKYLEDNGVIPKRTLRADRIRELLVFFRIASPKCMDAILGEFGASYRKRETKHGTMEGRFVWLSIGRRIVETKAVSYPDYDEKAFKAMLVELRKRLKDGIDKSRLQKMFEDVGVVLVFVPKIKNNVVYGATYWHCGRPVIQMACHYPTGDQFWFNLIHEARHVMCGNKASTSLNTGETDDEEQEADNYAAEYLLPSRKFQRFLDSFPSRAKPNINDIETCAKALDVPVSIVLGRLQYLKIIPYQAYRQLQKDVSFGADLIAS